MTVIRHSDRDSAREHQPHREHRRLGNGERSRLLDRKKLVGTVLVGRTFNSQHTLWLNDDEKRELLAAEARLPPLPDWTAHPSSPLLIASVCVFV